MTKYLLAAFTVLVLAFGVSAQTIGEVSSGGMTFIGDGLWRHPDGVSLYSRAWVSGVGSWVNGCYQPARGYWSYTQVRQSTPAVSINNIVNLDYKRVDFRDQAMTYILADAKERSAQRDFIEIVKTLGLSAPQYGGGYNVNGSGFVNYGASGSTVYGINAYPQGVQAYNAMYNDNSLAVLGQALSQSMIQSGTYFDKFNTAGASLLKAELDHRGKVAQIFGIAQAVELMNRPQVVQQGYQWSVTPNGEFRKDDSKVPQGVREKNLNAWATVAGAKCATCHTEGGKGFSAFDLNRYLTMSPAEKQKVMGTLTNPDPNRRMPLALQADGSVGRPGVPLTQDEIQLFFLN
jgi:mono/diheme cytochrome c family protein